MRDRHGRVGATRAPVAVRTAAPSGGRTYRPRRCPTVTVSSRRPAAEIARRRGAVVHLFAERTRTRRRWARWRLGRRHGRRHHWLHAQRRRGPGAVRDRRNERRAGVPAAELRARRTRTINDYLVEVQATCGTGPGARDPDHHGDVTRGGARTNRLRPPRTGPPGDRPEYQVQVQADAERLVYVVITNALRSESPRLGQRPLCGSGDRYAWRLDGAGLVRHVDCSAGTGAWCRGWGSNPHGL